ncbi:2OG-Fe(II) oxygenase [Sphingomonas sp.]|jgi:Rps23 Pro-64 3,4-dihydroxylase Tpa1-like proline 4-hydroxylase|uniref:2OG-Fe(II) oxygenase n=1 Tax=Sphingomonas sp. TaxID=28214 RepID=UPI002D7ED1B6|nr:2OG-Fe(II) oxygenase [Sphingomonas sp.]HEU0045929.1 2OG-Fe(II) oxygenase [Sphingomonas sp.]
MATLVRSEEMLRRDALAEPERLRAAYQAATPYPHLIIDDFLDGQFADQVHEEARLTAANKDASNGITQSLKVACTDWAAFGPQTHRLISYFNSDEFIARLGEIVGIADLFGDPELEGGGIHMTRRTGFLKMHTDFNWHDRLQADRRINILLYLNKDWQPAYRGELVLSDLELRDPVSVEPIFNRLVIFNTNDLTLHGHPDPLMFPDNYPRTSIAMYYYSHGKPEAERIRGRATTTRYLPRDKHDISLKQGSLKARLGYLARRFLRI